MASVEEMKEQVRQYTKRLQTNKVELACTVVSVYKSEPKPRMKDGMMVMGENNEPLFYPSRMSVKVAFTGGEADVPVTAEQYEKIKVGESYMLEGRQGMVKNFGSETLGIVYHSIEEL